MRNFGHQRPVRDEHQQVIEMADSPVSAITRDVYRWALQLAALNFTRKVREYKKTMSLKLARQKARKELGL